MKAFFRRLASFIHKISVLVSTPPARPVRVSPHCTNINMLLLHLCDFDAARYNYVLKWLAYPLRNPGARMCYGLLVTGEQGTGKNLFFECVALALHQGNGRLIQPDKLSASFTGWCDSPLAVIDGPITQRTVAHVKALMTSATVVIKRKGQEPRVIPNPLNFVFLSGDINAIRGDGSRRFMVIDAPPKREQNFYQAVVHEIRSGGASAFREYLMHGIDLDGFNESTLPPGLDPRAAHVDVDRAAGALQEAA